MLGNLADRSMIATCGMVLLLDDKNLLFNRE